MKQKEDTSTITLRICDLHSVLYLLSLGNEGAVRSAWDTIDLMNK